MKIEETVLVYVGEDVFDHLKIINTHARECIVPYSQLECDVIATTQEHMLSLTHIVELYTRSLPYVRNLLYATNDMKLWELLLAQITHPEEAKAEYALYLSIVRETHKVCCAESRTTYLELKGDYINISCPVGTSTQDRLHASASLSKHV